MSGTLAGLSSHDLALDHALAELDASFQFLLDVTPINLMDARASFLGGGADAPPFAYRELEDPDVIRARLDGIDPESVEDHTLSHLFRAKHRELCLQAEMLAARETHLFRTLSIELYGAVSPSLLEQAEAILDQSDPTVPAGDWLDADEFARRADEELAWYRGHHPDLEAQVKVRRDCSAVMVSSGNLLIPTTARVASSRVDAILQHEIGTHVVTFVNGARQPIRLLAGLAGYDEAQEGLALLAEHLVGGLTPGRLRQLAARVVAVQRMLDGESFRGVHAALTAAGFSPGAAFVTTMRAFRSGGFTKDAVYLRGLANLLAHVGAGGAIEPLLLGKMSLEALPLVEELRERGALIGPTLLPRYLVLEGASRRLGAIHSDTTVLDLVRSVS